MWDETRAAAVWGDLFEIAVKRGCLALLQARDLLPDTPHLAPWRERLVDDLHRHALAQLDVVDPGERRRCASTLDHLLLEGWAVGWTTLREALRHVAGGPLRLEALFCSLVLPDRGSREPPDRADRLAELWRQLGLAGRPDWAWLERGEPGNADFLVVFQTEERRHILVIECSLYAPPLAEDFGEAGPHLAELQRFAQRLDHRGVFTRIGVTVTGEEFTLSDGVISHLSALTNRDKPLYKLCQGSSYATRLLDRCRARYPEATVQVIAVTNGGIEAVTASFGRTHDLRAALMRSLGEAYRRAVHLGDAGADALDREIGAVRQELVRGLPHAMREPFADAFEQPPSARAIDLFISEAIPDFLNPSSPTARAPLLDGVEDGPELRAFLGATPRARLAAALDARGETDQTTLRAIHAVAIEEALAACPPGELRVIAAEGHPGIGKTTAVMQALRRRDEGFWWLYASPRLVINSDVTQKMAHGDDGRPSGILTLTTNRRLINGARRWWRERPTDGRRGDRYIDAAVAVDGTEGLVEPAGSILFLAPEEADHIDADYASADLRKQVLDERHDRIAPSRVLGVLSTLAKAAREALHCNPRVNRLVLTAAIQGFRDLGGAGGPARAGSTVERLSDLFANKASTPRGREERRAFAARVPLIAVMVDEIAGDGAGAPFVHALAAWLHQEFLEPFAAVGLPSPFRVLLILADASLGNEAVFGTYLAHGREAPEQVIVSSSHGPRPFRLVGTQMRLGGYLVPALHVMADGFPARSVRIDYRFRLDPVERRARAEGVPASSRSAILEEHGQRMLRGAVAEIYDSLRRLPADLQVIFFAQDKRLLRDVREALLHPSLLDDSEQGPIETGGLVLRDDDLGLLDSSVSQALRRQLLQETVRDRKRVFLMTSSGARGVSFPRAATIIALVPTFAVESGFMEVAQLIYRGRGSSRDPRTGAPFDGDTLDRRLVLVLHDFVVSDGPIDARQWLRRTIDLTAALVLLRATICTRVTGDACIPGQRATVVPVGRVGTEELAVSLSQSVDQFLRESAVFERERVPANRRALVKEARKAVLDVFRNLRWIGTLPDRTRQTVVTPSLVSALARQVCAAPAPLLAESVGIPVPEHVYALGPIWLERWSDVASEEAFGIDVRAHDDQRRIAEVRRRLYAIGHQRDLELPEALRRAARDLYAVLARPDDLGDRGFTVGRAIDSRRVWICLPLDYGRFCSDDAETPTEGFHLDAPEQWLDGLRRAAAAHTTPTDTYPVLPPFRDRPFVALLASGDPTGLDRAFDSRSFMASTELNLLNTILFVAQPEAVERRPPGSA